MLQIRHHVRSETSQLLDLYFLINPSGSSRAVDLWINGKPAGQRAYSHVDDSTPYSQARDGHSVMVWSSGLCTQDLRSPPHGIWTKLGTSAAVLVVARNLGIKRRHS